MVEAAPETGRVRTFIAAARTASRPRWRPIAMAFFQPGPEILAQVFPHPFTHAFALFNTRTTAGVAGLFAPGTAIIAARPRRRTITPAPFHFLAELVTPGVGHFKPVGLGTSWSAITPRCIVTVPGATFGPRRRALAAGTAVGFRIIAIAPAALGTALGPRRGTIPPAAFSVFTEPLAHPLGALTPIRKGIPIRLRIPVTRPGPTGAGPPVATFQIAGFIAAARSAFRPRRRSLTPLSWFKVLGRVFLENLPDSSADALWIDVANAFSDAVTQRVQALAKFLRELVAARPLPILTHLADAFAKRFGNTVFMGGALPLNAVAPVGLPLLGRLGKGAARHQASGQGRGKQCLVHRTSPFLRATPLGAPCNAWLIDKEHKACRTAISP